MLEWIILGGVFLSVFGIALVMVRGFTADDRRINSRLTDNASETPFHDENLLLGDLTESLGNLTLPANGKKLALERELRAAGYYGSKAVLEYAALRALLIATPLFACALLALLVDTDVLPYVVGGGLILAILGYSVPRVYVNYLARQRSRQVERGLPVAIDLLSLCLTGGQNILTALARVAHDLEFSFPVLSQEIRIVHKHAQMVGLDVALQHFAGRANVQEVKNLSVILTHTERLGTSIAAALLEFSTNFRLTLRQRAEELANRTSFWMLFPTMLCLLLPALLMFNAPLYFEFSRARKDLSENVQKGMQVLQNEKQSAPTPP